MTDHSIDSIYNQPKEATMQQPVQQTPEWTQVLSMFDAMFSVALRYAEPQIKRMVDDATAPLLARIELLERSLVVADKAAQGNESDLFSRVATLEEQMIAKQDNIDERIKEIAEEVAANAISDHNDLYDHDEYDRSIGGIDDRINEAIDDHDFEDKLNKKVNKAIKECDLEDMLREALRNMTFSITTRY
jgi:ATP-dependent Lon protease